MTYTADINVWGPLFFKILKEPSLVQKYTIFNMKAELIFMKIKQKKNKSKNGPLKKTEFLNSHQFSIFFAKNLRIDPWVSRID